MHNRVARFRFPLLLLLATGGVSGCDGGEPVSMDAATTADASSPVDAGVGTDTAPPPGPSVSAGVCRYTIVANGVRTRVESEAAAVMNGSGNLRIRCRGEVGEPELLLNVGNGTFDGPRRYVMNDFRQDGTIKLELGEESFDSGDERGSCVTELTEAEPYEPRRSLVTRGGRVSATFVCDNLPRDSYAGTLDRVLIEDGEVVAMVE